METAILILSYVASIFLNRWLNKLSGIDPFVGLWFIPVFGTFIPLFFCGIELYQNLEKSENKFIKWFRGDNW